MVRSGLVPLLFLSMLSALGCSKSEPEVRPEPPRPVAKTTAPPPSDPAPSASIPMPTGPLVLARGVRIAHAAQGADAARVVRDAREREKADSRELVVYVGAKWCEPCQRFHRAAQAGELDDAFPTLTLLEFDLDEDKDRLEAAGYQSELIPLFVMPDERGLASNKRFEGSVKGDGAIANIAPRLRALLVK